MLAKSREQYLALYLKELAKNELETEIARQNLAQEPLFDPEFTFIRLDKKAKGYISLKDLMQFIKYGFIPLTFKGMRYSSKSRRMWRNIENARHESKVHSFLSRVFNSMSLA